MIWIICADVLENGFNNWKIVGASSSQSEAEKLCLDKTYFLIPVAVPQKSMPGMYHPKTQVRPRW